MCNHQQDSGSAHDSGKHGGAIFRNRLTGACEREARGDIRAMRFIYGQGSLSRIARRIVRRPIVSKIVGWRYDRPANLQTLRRFVLTWGIDMNEAEFPLERYTSINNVFARRLKAGIRPIDTSSDRIIAPADSRAFVYPDTSSASLPVKGCALSIGELLRDTELSRRFAASSAAVFRLAPRDYHRFHFPLAGVAGKPRTIPGVLDSVAPLALDRDPRLLCYNARDIVLLQTEHAGLIAIAVVGALLVGSITETYVPGGPVSKGDEQGFFTFGGSSLVILCEAGRVRFDDDLIRSTADGIETDVRMGMGIATIVTP